MQIIIRYKKQVVGNMLYEWFFYPFQSFEFTPPNWETFDPVVKFGIRWGFIIKTKTQIDN